MKCKLSLCQGSTTLFFYFSLFLPLLLHVMMEKGGDENLKKRRGEVR